MKQIPLTHIHNGTNVRHPKKSTVNQIKPKAHNSQLTAQSSNPKSVDRCLLTVVLTIIKIFFALSLTFEKIFSKS